MINVSKSGLAQRGQRIIDSLAIVHHQSLFRSRVSHRESEIRENLAGGVWLALSKKAGII
jgi:hypothetical protein